MNTIYLRLFALGFAFTLTACDNKSPASAKNSVNAMVPIEANESVVESPQTLKLNVDEVVLKGLKTSAEESVSLSDSLKLEIKPVEDERRLSVNGKLLMQDTWQPDYLDNIVGGKLELQLRFND